MLRLNAKMIRLYRWTLRVTRMEIIANKWANKHIPVNSTFLLARAQQSETLIGIQYSASYFRTMTILMIRTIANCGFKYVAFIALLRISMSNSVITIVTSECMQFAFFEVLLSLFSYIAREMLECKRVCEFRKLLHFSFSLFFHCSHWVIQLINKRIIIQYRKCWIAQNLPKIKEISKMWLCLCVIGKTCYMRMHNRSMNQYADTRVFKMPSNVWSHGKSVLFFDDEGFTSM